MEEIANLFQGFAVALQPFNMMVMVVGVVLGVIIGVLRVWVARTASQSCCP